MREFELSVDGLREYRECNEIPNGADQLIGWAIDEILAIRKKREFYRELIDQIGVNASPCVTDVLRILYELAGEKDAVERKLFELEVENKSIRKSLGREREGVIEFKREIALLAGKLRGKTLEVRRMMRNISAAKQRIAELGVEIDDLNEEIRCKNEY